VAAAALFAALPPRAAAQGSGPTARLVVTVVDSTQGVLPTAVVTPTCVDASGSAIAVPAGTADAKGMVAFDNLPATAVCTVASEFNGFSPNSLKNLKLKAGENRHVLVLPLKALTDSVTVSEDRQSAASDRGVSFGSAMTREQIDALSDDPTEMQRQLQDLAGPDAIMRVDGFEGAPLPNKAQIKAIHITRDQFAAENHSAGATFIDIITQPGIGPLRLGTNFNYQDSRLDGRNPLIPTKGPGRSENYGFNVSGTIAHNKSSYSLFVNDTKSFSTPTLYAAAPNGAPIAQVTTLRAPRDFLNLSGLFDYTLTRDQTLRVGYNQSSFSNSNLGVNGFNLPERAYSNDATNYALRVQEAGPLGRRFFTNTRLAVNKSDNQSHADLNAQTILVQDAFTSGGAQVSGGTKTWNVSLQSDLDYVRGIHSFRTGIQLNSNAYNSDSNSNYLGTYTFTSLDAFNASQPALFTQRVGNPLVRYDYFTGGIYAQDDIRVRKNLTISAGVRYELQNHISDYNNFGPRAGITWAPFKSGKTTLRASAGIFYEYVGSGILQQTLQFDGFHEEELNVVNPVFLTDGAVGGNGVISPTNKYEFGSGIEAQRSSRLSASASQQVLKRVTVNATYAHVRSYHQLSGVDLNLPVNGVRPNSAFSDVIAAESDAHSISDSLSTNVQVSIAPPSPALQKARFNWRRGSVSAFYTIAKADSDALGAFIVSPTGTLATEWGPANFDVRHRFSANFNTQALKNMNASFSFSASSGSPYTITTGFDDNADFIFNDRPAGVGRNTLRTTGQWNLSAFFSYGLNFGGSTAIPTSSIMIMQAMGAAVSQLPQSIGRYRLNFFANVFNMTNHANLTGFSGVQTSPFFMQPTAASGTRSVNFGVNFSF
jgi:hypothetical protein